MLKSIRKYKNSVLGIVAIGTVALAMSGFGVDLFSKKQTERYAIKVNDQIIGFDELNAEKRQIENRYRQMLGKDYAKMVEVFKINTQQQAVDKLISDTLLTQFGKEIGFFASDANIRNMLVNEVLGGQYSEAAYKAVLNEFDLSAGQFENSLRSLAIRAQVVKLLTDSSIASAQEARSVIEDEKTKYSAKYVELDPAKYIGQVGNISDADIEIYYNEHVADFQIPERVSYEYAAVDPSGYYQAVEITDDDIEAYYAEHQGEYMTDEEINVRYIQVSVPTGADEKKREDLKKKAEEALKKAQEGAQFADLVKQYSDDYATAMSGGSTGWIKHGKMNKAFDDAAFKLLEGELSGVVESPSAFYVIKMEELKPARQKELSEVRAAVEHTLRSREAPAYAASKAADMFDEFSKGGKTLSEYASQKGVKVAVTKGLLDKSQDPDPSLRGLTAKVLETPGDKYQLAEIDGKSVLVSVLEYKESEPAQLSAVKDKAKEALTKRAAVEVTKLEAQKLVDASTDSFESFKKAAESQKLPLQEANDMTKAGAPLPFTDNQMKAALFASTKVFQKPQKFFEVNGKFYVFQVTGISKPTEEEINKEIDSARKEASEELTQIALRSIIEKLKARGKVDIDPMALAGR